MRILFRVDAYPEIGNGHLMRCLALAAELRARGAEAVFVSRIEPAHLREEVARAGFEIVGVPENMADLPLPTEWVVLDGYKFGFAEQREIKVLGVSLMVIDDMATQEEYCADLVLNQNALDVHYPGARHVLLGPSFALLRPEFARAMRRTEDTNGIPRVLMTLGGGTQPVVAQVLFAALRDCGHDLHVRVIGARPRVPITRAGLVLEFLDYADDMPAQMAWADLALCGGGSTCWELACRGVPALITVLSEDQKRVTEQMVVAGCGIRLGWHAELTETVVLDALNRLLDESERFEQMRRDGPILVDGRGARRVAQVLLEEHA
jgi:UDP-2,4-diacetamido-2,4,6-trideoxy-beta-L-altropyranose hydrolase